MGDWRQTEIPPVKAVEKGRRLAPEYETELNEFDVVTAEWTHVCSCRFGEARESPVGRWSGDSYRYDIFANTDARQIAMRWSNGGSDGWLTDRDHKDRNEAHLLGLIADVADEAHRWDLCHKLLETAHKSALAGVRSERHRMFAAFCDGKLKKRKRGDKYIMEIVE